MTGQVYKNRPNVIPAEVVIELHNKFPVFIEIFHVRTGRISIPRMAVSRYHHFVVDPRITRLYVVVVIFEKC